MANQSIIAEFLGIPEGQKTLLAASHRSCNDIIRSSHCVHRDERCRTFHICFVLTETSLRYSY